jgi:hypothetical protein
MTVYFQDRTNRFNPREVILYSKNSQYYCESQQHLIKEITPYTFVCNECIKEYMGPVQRKLS